nr:paraquat-inducible protein A [Nitrosopumilus sp.]
MNNNISSNDEGKVSYTFREKIFRLLFILALLPVLAYAGWCGYNIKKLSVERSLLKKHYSELNNIQHGLLSVDRWRTDITEIVATQINEFELSKEQQDDMKKEINVILNKLITQADEMINEKQKSVGGKLKKFAFNTFINTDKIRERIPEFSQTIINEMTKPRSMDNLKSLANAKIDDFAAETRDSLAGDNFKNLLLQYEAKDVSHFNTIVTIRSEILQEKAYNLTFIMLGIMFFFLLLWLLVTKAVVLYRPLFTLSVMLALILLYTGLVAPMIEIDARIREMNFILIGKNIQFHNQVLFYQSKSILDVVNILISTRKADSVLVGVLLLVFSIIFPVSKLLATNIYLFGNQKWKNSNIMKFFAFQSGKWSMADVMVVAIFMAYIGFNGILDSEMGKMNMDMN